MFLNVNEDTLYRIDEIKSIYVEEDILIVELYDGLGGFKEEEFYHESNEDALKHYSVLVSRLGRVGIAV